MFKATLNDPEVFKNSMGVISNIIDECLFKVDSNGLSLLSPDRNVIVVVDFKLLSTAFDEFEVEGEVNLGLNMANLMGILKRVKPTDKVTLKSTANKLEIVVEGGNGKRKFDLPLLDLKVEKPPIDQLKFTGKADLESHILEEGVEDAGVVSDSVVLEVSPELFKLAAKGDVSSAPITISSLKEQTRGGQQVRFDLVIENKGGGEVYNPSVSCEELDEEMFRLSNGNKVKLEIVNPVNVKCDFKDKEPENSGIVELKMGKATVSCWLDVNDEPYADRLSLKLDYMYRDDTSTNIRIFEKN